MRSFKWQALFAAAMFAVPSLAMAQTQIRVDDKQGQNENQNQNNNENQNENQNENPNERDPFFAVRDEKPRVDVKVDKRIEAKPTIRLDGKKMTYTIRTGRMTDSSGISLSTVPPAMAAQLRLQPGVGVVVEQLAQGSSVESAGVEQYDVIEKIGGRQIHQPQDIGQAIRDAKSDTVTIDIVRQAHRQSLNVDRNQLREAKAFTFSRGEPSPMPPKGFARTNSGMEFQFDNKNGNPNQADGDRQRDKADREREKADREREKVDRERDRAQERAQRDKDRQSARRDIESAMRDKQNEERNQLNSVREQIKSQLDRERGELDKAREQLNRATQEMNQRLNELRAKLDNEMRQKFEAEMRKGQDQIREKMQLLEQQGRDLEKDDSQNEKN